MFYTASFLPFFSLMFLVFVYCSNGFHQRDETSHLTTYLDYDSGVLIVATLDGSLNAVDRKTGETLWTLKNEPTVKVYMKHKTPISPIFLPDPKDGSLYMLNIEEKHGLTKLPFNIQQLVVDSPTKSQDGIFYFGKKQDSWISIDNITGEKNVLLSTEEFEKVCPLQSPNVFFIGRTEYNLALIDSKRNNNNWNITYYDYASRTLSSDQLSRYEYIHFSGSGSGRVRTIDRKTGLLEWEKDFGSPMVSLYLHWGKDIFSLPFTSAADASLDSLPFITNQIEHELKPSLFIGEHNFGYYALPALVDSEVPILTDSLHHSRFLLSGPEGAVSHNALILGHYKIPPEPISALRISGKTKKIIHDTILNGSERSIEPEQSQGNAYISPESKILVTLISVVTIFFTGMFIYVIRQVREIKQSSQGTSRGSTGVVSTYSDQKGIVTVGKISFDTQQILGKGCEGTFVFRGEFDGRDVAVKRLLPECFTIADREVELLRESDSHANVIRYFSTEQDSQFRYIALELCSSTLQDYVEKGLYKEDISPVDVLKQATLGLEHLHSLKIVHRDIKPHNILLALGNHQSKIRVLISDFGLCKKLPNGKNSFSKKSGITGTEGWIAPEIMNSSGRIMSAVDIFSLGCVFFYTIVGKHPFGDSLRRQSNILLGEKKLDQLSDELWKTLIDRMICLNPLDRPSAATVKGHPVFWEKSFILSFLQDVSDRVDKEKFDSPVLLQLEKGGEVLYGSDWKNLIDPELTEDIGKYRSYRGDSVRDLLRAFRNKRHHYRDLSDTAQKLLGVSAESYVNYWLSRFPRLLYHVWSSMQLLRNEPCFTQYYDKSYDFPCDKTDVVPEWINEMKYVNIKQKKSPVKIFKKQMNLSFNEDRGNKLDAWINAGMKNGAWRPKQLRREMEEKNVTWKLTS